MCRALVPILVLALGGCASQGEGVTAAPRDRINISTRQDSLRVIADADAFRMPAVLVLADRLLMQKVLIQLYESCWPLLDGASPEASVSDTQRLSSDRPLDAIQGMLSIYWVYWINDISLAPDSWMAASDELLELRRLAAEGEEPARSRAIALLVSVRDASDFEALRVTISAARAVKTEPLASALRVELSEESLLEYVGHEAWEEDGAKSGRWALQVIAAERRERLIPELLLLLESREDLEYGLALVHCFYCMGGRAGASGLRSLTERSEDFLVRKVATEWLEVLEEEIAEK